MAISTAILDTPIDLESLREAVSANANGAVNIFLGVTRDHHEGRAVRYLEYHCYREMAERELRRVAEEVAHEYGLRDFAVFHRVGRVNVGEASLGVAAGAPHRRNAIEATLEFVNRLKKDVPIWKREYFADGGVGWVEGGTIIDSPDTAR